MKRVVWKFTDAELERVSHEISFGVVTHFTVEGRNGKLEFIPDELTLAQSGYYDFPKGAKFEITVEIIPSPNQRVKTE